MQLSVAADGMCIGKARSCLLTTRMPCDADNDQREQMDGMASLAGGRGGQSEPYMPSGVRSSGTAVLARTPRVAHTEDACSISFASAQHFRFDVESRPSNAGMRFLPANSSQEHVSPVVARGIAPGQLDVTAYHW